MSIYDDDWGDVETPPRRVSLSEQEQRGLVPHTNKNTFVQPTRAYEISQVEGSLLSNATTAAGEIMTHRQMTHIARSDDTAVTHAAASLLYSAAYSGVFLAVAVFVGAILMLNMDEGQWVVGAILFLSWGSFTMYMLWHNREQGLHHSSAGIAHAEIDSRERIALHAIDKHAAIIEKRLGLHHDTRTDD